MRLTQFLRMSDNPQHNRSLWGIGWMSFFWSTATVMVFSLLPTFMTDVLGASKTKVGLIEGIAVFSAFCAKVFSGVLSDFIKKRKPLIMIGTFLSILIKIMFALAGNLLWIFAARSIDRLSKGIRSAPTDALIADLSPQKKEGASYGIRYTLYMLGAVCGGAITVPIFHFSNSNYRLVFWCSLIPATLAFIVLILFVHPPKEQKPEEKKPWRLKDAKHLPPAFWQLLGVISLLMMARFSEAFLTLHAKDLGWAVVSLPLLMIGYDFFNAGLAIPIGKLADRFDRQKLLLAGILVLTFTNILILSLHVWWGILIGILCAGVHMGMTQGLLSALVAEHTLPHLRGTAFALYYLTTGAAVLVGNTIAGHLADYVGGTYGAFYGGLVFTSAAAGLLVWMIYKRPETA